MLQQIKTQLKNKLIRETSWSFATKGISVVFFFLLNFYLANVLGPDQFGVWSFFFSIFTMILLFSNFGVSTSSGKFVAEYVGTPQLNNILKNAFLLRLLVSSLFALGTFLISVPLANWLERPHFAYYLQLAAPLVLFSGYIVFLKAVFIGLHRIKYNFIVNVLEFGLKFLFAFLVLFVSLDIANIVNAFTLAAFITIVVGLYLLYTNFYDADNLQQGIDFTKVIFQYAIPLMFVRVGFLVVTEVDTFMLGVLSTDKEVGVYSVAKQLVTKLPQISYAIAMGSMPIFAKLNKKNKAKLTKLFVRLLKINGLIFGVIAVLLLSLSWFFVPLLFPAYGDAVLPLQILTVYIVAFSFSVLLNNFLDFRGLAKKRAIHLWISMFINIILNFLLIPHYGAVGAAIATSVSHLPYLMLNGIEVYKVLK